MTCTPPCDPCTGQCADEFLSTINRLDNSGCEIACAVTPERLDDRDQVRDCRRCVGEPA